MSIIIICLVLLTLSFNVGCKKRHSRSAAAVATTDPTDTEAQFIPYNHGKVVPDYGRVSGGESVTILLPAGAVLDFTTLSVYFCSVDDGLSGNEAMEIIIPEDNPWYITCKTPPSFTSQKGVVDVVLSDPIASHGGGGGFPSPESIVMENVFTYIDPVTDVDYLTRQQFQFGFLEDFCIVDFDDDGWDDLIGHDPVFNRIDFLKNDSGEGFSSFFEYEYTPTTTDYYAGFAVGDINIDNKPDIVIYGRNSLIFLENNSADTMSFIERVYDDSRKGISGQIGNLDNSGCEEIILAGPDAVRVYNCDYSSGHGPNFTVIKLPVTFTIRNVVLADINNDGFKDIITLCHDRLICHISEGGHAFTAQPPLNIDPSFVDADYTYLVSADMNNDNYEDVIFASAFDESSGKAGDAKLAVALSTGTNGFNEPIYSAITGTGEGMTGATDLKVIDLNHDNNQDVIITLAGFNSAVVYKGDGSGSSLVKVAYAVGLNPDGLLVHDFDKDGSLDLMTSNLEEGKQNYLEGIADSGLENLEIDLKSGIDYHLNIQPLKLEVCDIDHDQVEDIFILDNAMSGIYRFVINDLGNFDLFKEIGANDTRLIDFCFFHANGIDDSHIDLALIKSDLNQTTWSAETYLNDGNGLFTSQTLTVLGMSAAYLDKGDLNNDGHTDLSVLDGQGLTLKVLFSDGKGGVSQTQERNSSRNLSNAILSDMDLDYDLDLIASCRDEMCIQISPTDENGAINWGPNFFLFNLFFVPDHVMNFDFTTDGIHDLVITSFDDPTCYFYQGINPSDYLLSYDLPLSDGAQQVVPVDFDYDRRTDLMALTRNGTGLDLFNNNEGTIEKSDMSPLLLSEYNDDNRIRLIDLNNDLLKEIVVTSKMEQKVTVIWNVSK